jgi:hypothetical protein
MRSTQFVGLTKVAEDFVKDLEQLESDHSTSGMFEEEIPLRKWVLHPKIKSWGREGECIREVVQTVPWSSGPMIFTCLEVDHGSMIQLAKQNMIPKAGGCGYESNSRR